MRELTQDEAGKVGGGDGVHLGGNSYISNTRVVTNRLGAAGAVTLAFEVGYGAGTFLDSQFGWSQDLGGYAYENS